MAEPQLVEFPQDGSARFYCCGECKTHLALCQQSDCRYSKENWMLVKDLVNVNLDEHQMISNGLSTVKSVYCKTCKADLGFKLIQIQKEDDIVRTGSYLVDRRTLLMGDGNKMIKILNDSDASA